MNTMDYSYICLFGLKTCGNFEATQTVGEIVRWFEVLGLGGVIFSISEFIEKRKLNTYLFKFTRWSVLLLCCFLGSIGAVVIANIVPFIPGPAWLLIGYPASWEFLSLLLMTVFLLIFAGISFKAAWFVPRLGPKNLPRFLRILNTALYVDKTPESMAAASRILEGRRLKSGEPENLSALVRIASDPQQSEDVRTIVWQLIEQILSEQDYTKYLATENLYQTYMWYHLAAKHDLRRNDIGFFFFQSLTSALYEEKDSWLGKEEQYTGMGVGKSLHHLLFKSLDHIGGFQLFGSFLCKEDSNEYHVLRRKLNGLLMSLETYYESTDYQDVHSHTTLVLNNAVKLGYNHGWYKLPKSYNEIWEHPLRKSVDHVERFYRDLENIIGGHSIDQQLSNFEKGVSKDSVAEGITEGMFEFLEELSMIENIEFARQASCSIFWVIFQPSKKEIVQNMEKKLLPLIQKRMKYNMEGSFHSMIRLLLEIYGFAFYSKEQRFSIIGEHVKNEFVSTIATRCLEDAEFAADHLPPSWRVEDDKIIRKGYKIEPEQQMYPAPTSSKGT